MALYIEGRKKYQILDKVLSNFLVLLIYLITECVKLYVMWPRSDLYELIPTIDKYHRLKLT